MDNRTKTERQNDQHDAGASRLIKLNELRPYGTKPHKMSKRQRGQLDAFLRMEGYRSYFEYLSSPHWKMVQERYRSSGLPQTCLVCLDATVELHHRTYNHIGEEHLRLHDLVALCKKHHTQIHQEGLGMWDGPGILLKRELAERRKRYGRRAVDASLQSRGISRSLVMQP